MMKPIDSKLKKQLLLVAVIWISWVILSMVRIFIYKYNDLSDPSGAIYATIGVFLYDFIIKIRSRND